MTLMYTPWMVASGESLGVEATGVNFKREGRPGSEQAQYLED